MASIASSFVNGYINDDRYKTTLSNHAQQAQFMKAPYELTSGAIQSGLLRKPANVSAGFGQMLEEKSKQEQQVHANAINNTGSPYAANSFVDAYLQQSNYQQMRMAQKNKGRYTGNSYMTIPFVLLFVIAGIILFRKLR